MTRQRDPADVRRDALRMGAAKLASGCSACAEGYFNLARQHGATESELEAAAAGPTHAPITRRTFLKRTAVGVGTLSAAGAVLGSWRPGVSLASRSGGSVAWVAGGQGKATEVLAVDPSGTLIASIQNPPAELFRSPDRESLILAYSLDSGQTATTVVQQFSASNGALTNRCSGRTLSLGAAARDGGFEASIPAVSPDGRYLLVLRQTRRILIPDARSFTKRAPTIAADPVLQAPPPGATITVTKSTDTVVNGVELFDLQQGAALGYLQISSSPANAFGGAITFDPGSTRAYIALADTNFREVLIEVTFPPLGLGTIREVPRSGLPVPAPSLVEPDGATLVRVVSGDVVQWISLLPATSDGELELPACSCSKGCPAVALFLQGGGFAYIARSSTGEVDRLDLSTRAIVDTLSMPSASPEGPITLGAAAIAPDEDFLYLSGGARVGGLYTISLPDLQLVGVHLSGVPIVDIWVAQGGSPVYVLDTAGAIYVLDSLGQPTPGLQPVQTVPMARFIR